MTPSTSLFVIFYTILITCVVTTQSQLLFRAANARVAKSLESDRPCKSLLTYRDAHLKTPQVIERYGFKPETHKVVTEDGYIITVHRIPAPGKPAVYLLHGVFSSSRDYLVNCERRALAIKLADAGFDVWIGNYRGNTYNMNHTFLSPNDPKFWDFSNDEIALLDTPAVIDHILNVTGQATLSYVGMSMGNGIILALLSERPEYNAKINVWFAMGASLDFKGIRTPFFKTLATIWKSFERYMTRFHRGEFIGQRLYSYLHNYLPIICRREGRSKNYHGLCASLFFLNDGYDPGQVPPELMSVILGELPAPTSVKAMTQWMQWIRRDKFTKYDEGAMRNLARWGNVTAPTYQMQNVDVPIVLFWSKNDWVTSSSSVESLIKQAKAIRSDLNLTVIKVPPASWNHFDFVYGKDADVFIYKHIIERLKQV